MESYEIPEIRKTKYRKYVNSVKLKNLKYAKLKNDNKIVKVEKLIGFFAYVKAIGNKCSAF